MKVSFKTEMLLTRAQRAVRRGLYYGGNLVRNEALRLILDTPKTGRIYRRRGIEHQASAPGEAPASDTGTLVRNIRLDTSELEKFRVRVVASTAYAQALEYGTARMEPRPFMRPALAAKKAEIEAALATEVARVFARKK